MTFDYDFKPGLRSSWNAAKLIVRKPLTDRRIKQYEKRGWYDESFREARRELMARKAAQRRKRSGNFLIGEDGRPIYSPV